MGNGDGVGVGGRVRPDAKMWGEVGISLCPVRQVRSGVLCKHCSSVGDPDPEPDPDPHVFGPPGSGSNSQRYGSGSGSGSGSFPILINVLSGLK
jgi:hypothetical protein